MIVAGPNSRLDFHVKMGEALYYQLKRMIDLDCDELPVTPCVHRVLAYLF
jgi:hypothetical protein